MTTITRAALVLALGLGALAACSDGDKGGEDAEDRVGTTAGPGTSGGVQGAGPAATTADGAGAGTAAVPTDSAVSPAAGTMPADSAGRDTLAPPPR